MKKIQIGNDFTVSWLLTHLGKAFSPVNKTFEIEVSSAYGTILVSDVFTEGNILTFLVPSSQQVYLGSYDISLTITEEVTGQRWSLKQCNAFALVPCNSEFVNDEIVQLESGIVFPSHGLSAYELAVLNGYPGTYDEWVRMYAGLKPTRISFIGISGEVLHTIEVAAPVEYSSYGSSYAYEPVGDWGDMTESYSEEPIGEWSDTEASVDENVVSTDDTTLISNP